MKIDFIGIGAKKSGTTTISKLLEEHPDICFSFPKELMYFNSNNSRRFKEPENKFNKKPISWYLSHFKNCKGQKVKGEFTPAYFNDSDAPQNIKNIFPDTKLIVCLRNPVDRAYSHYQMVKNYHLAEKDTFSTAIRRPNDYVDDGLYYNQLKQYLNHFSLNQIKIIFFEDLKTSPYSIIKDLYQFLEVDPDYVPKNVNLKSNSATKTKIGFLKDLEFFLIKTLPALGLGQVLKKVKGIKWLHKIYTTPNNYEPIKIQDKNFLHEVFLKDIEDLEKLLQRDLSSWKK